MDINKNIHLKVDTLGFNQNIAFCMFNAERVVQLYRLFDDMVQRENLEPLNGIINGSAVLVAALDCVKKNYDNLEELDTKGKTEIETYLKECDKLMPDDEDYGGYETTIAQFVCSTIPYTLSYCLKKDVKYSKQNSDCLFNIINNIVSENYFKKFQNNNFAEKRIIVVKYYESEVQTQMNFIDSLDITPSFDHVFDEALRMKISADNYLV